MAGETPRNDCALCNFDDKHTARTPFPPKSYAFSKICIITISTVDCRVYISKAFPQFETPRANHQLTCLPGYLGFGTGRSPLDFEESPRAEATGRWMVTSARGSRDIDPLLPFSSFSSPRVSRCGTSMSPNLPSSSSSLSSSMG